ncbi:ArsR/SmtB family transcription factor [Nocardioides acrostichi]|uniref:Helix-turn-helix transcriptional regulator n=1 Tax=Nocardioides acrostichi TaxID=2784339 RepID=A0A930Y7J9_9ACTN|nr:helix-turn-helix domain-containing protein [Nocardioides acrostichi]MBF4163505.1 helix-turn-helix transcriptional regulator [Nocardioides acrostichi]
MPRRRLTQPRELRALAHPVRIAIIEQLSLDGPLTATELADRLDETPANCSWHLRKLAEHELVEEAPSEGGRRRPWRLPVIGLEFQDADDEPETHRAATAFSEMVVGRAVERLRESHERAPREPHAWRRAATTSQSMAWLTAEELEEVNEAIRQVLLRHSERIEDPSARPEGARLCEMVAWGVPVYLMERER